MRIVTLLLLFYVPVIGFGQAAVLNWASRLGGTSSDACWGMAPAGSGQNCLVGNFTGSSDFNPGPGGYFLTSAGNSDAYVCKLDVAGEMAWAVRFGGSFADLGNAVTVDSWGNVYATGTFFGSGDFDPGLGVYTLNGSFADQYIFVVKLDASANFIWARMLGGSLDDKSLCITADSSGNVIIGGEFKGNCDMDPGPAVYNLVSAGEEDGFLCKLDASGNFLWAGALGSSGHDQVKSVKVNSAGDIFITGRFEGSVDADFSSGTQMLNSGGQYDAFFCRLSPSGSLQWARSIGGGGVEYPMDMVVDTGSNSYIAGVFMDHPSDFDPGPGSTQLVPFGYHDAFVMKLDASGNFAWAKQLGGDDYDNAYGVAIDSLGDVYVTGYFRDTADFDPGPAVYPLVANAGAADGFVVRLNASGNFEWAGRIGGQGYDYPQAIVTGPNQAVYTSGVFQLAADMDPGPLTDTLTSAGGYDVFAFKLTPCQPTSVTLQADSCYRYTLNGTSYYSSGTYTQLLHTAMGCDSLVSLELQIHDSVSSVLSLNACDSILLNTIVYHTSGVYVQHLMSNSGCDSMLTAHVTIFSSVSDSFAVETCTPYSWNDTVYTVSGHYTQHLTSAGGCDSAVTLLLTVNGPDNGVIQNNAVLTAVAQGVSYQWIDCAQGNMIIPGATGQTFTASQDGLYAVIVNNGLCSDTSACFEVQNTATEEAGWMSGISIYPNPASEFIYLHSDEPLVEPHIRLMDTHGRVVRHWKEPAGNDFRWGISDLPPGIYFLEIRVGEHIFRKIWVLN